MKKSLITDNIFGFVDAKEFMQRFIEIATHGEKPLPDFMKNKKLPLGEVFMQETVEGDSKTMTVRINGVMGSYFGVDVDDIIKRLDEANPNEIVLLIESPGGTVSSGLALYSDLMSRQKDKGVVVKAEARGTVASSAILPFLAASERVMRDGSELMVHAPWAYLGLVGDLREMQSQFKRMENGLSAAEDRYRSIVVQRTGQSDSTVAKWLDTDTWFQPEAAIKNGLATSAEEVSDADKTDDESRASAESLFSFVLQAGF